MGKDGAIKATGELTNYWNQEAVENELKFGLKFRILEIVAMERL